MAKTLYLLRHGSTGQPGKFIGSTDLPIATEAYAQLDVTRKLLHAKNISTVFCSPKLRCRQTAEHLQLDVEAIKEPCLQEINFGAWEGKGFDDISSEWPREVDEWANWSEDFTFPGGENIRDFLQRVKKVRDQIELCQDEHILVVAHGGIIRQLICTYLGISSDKYLLFDIKAGCFSTLSLYSDGGILTSLNSGWK